jgi:hypothetical protein
MKHTLVHTVPHPRRAAVRGVCGRVSAAWSLDVLLAALLFTKKIDNNEKLD